MVRLVLSTAVVGIGHSGLRGDGTGSWEGSWECGAGGC
jgi:hypothetical protein